MTNGASGATAALISAHYYGVAVYGSAGTVGNFGTISASNVGVVLFAGGSVTNGASGASATG